jgi:hypothetical protein
MYRQADSWKDTPDLGYRAIVSDVGADRVAVYDGDDLAGEGCFLGPQQRVVRQ